MNLYMASKLQEHNKNDGSYQQITYFLISQRAEEKAKGEGGKSRRGNVKEKYKIIMTKHRIRIISIYEVTIF